MDDLISRQAALDAFGLSEKTRKYGGDHSGYDTMMLYEIQYILEDLPSVAPAQKWIPVSERLPEEGEEVLVWYRYWRYGEYNNWEYTYGIGYQYEDYWSVIDGGLKSKVYAWMPLPEPYKEAE